MNDLPVEIFREIIIHATNSCVLNRALRLRLVNQLFAHEIISVLYETSALDDYAKQIKDDQSIEHDHFWQQYLSTRIFLNRRILSERENIVRNVAKRLCEASNDHQQLSLRRYILALCYRPYRILTPTCVPSHKPWSSSRQLLQAAIINNCPEVIQKLLDCPDFFGVFGCCHSVQTPHLWANPIDLAAFFGRLDILELMFTDKRMSRRLLREEALGAAIRSGCLGTVQFILNQRWGPVDFINRVDCLTGNIVAGMLRSLTVDFFHRLSVIFESHRTCQYPIAIEKVNINELLYEISFRSPQRADVAAWLLDYGAMVQQKELPGKRVTVKTRKPPKWEQAEYESRKPWHPLRRAVQGGNEKIIRILLERGADPNATDYDVLEQAAKRGRLDMVCMLMEYGAEFESRQTYKADLARNPDSLLMHALRAGNVELHQYLYDRCVELNKEPTSKALERGGESMEVRLAELEATVSDLSRRRKSWK